VAVEGLVELPSWPEDGPGEAESAVWPEEAEAAEGASPTTNVAAIVPDSAPVSTTW